MNYSMGKSLYIALLFLFITQLGHGQIIYGLDLLKTDKSTTIYDQPRIGIVDPIKMSVFLLNNQNVYKRLKNKDKILIVGENGKISYLNINDSIYEVYSGSIHLNRYPDLGKAMEYLDSIKCEQIFKDNNYAYPKNGFMIDIKEVDTRKTHSLSGYDSVLILGVKNRETLYMSFKDILFESSIYDLSSPLLEDIIKKNDSKAKSNIKANKEKRKSSLILKYGNRTAEAILKGRVLIGMTEEMVEESLGRPYDINYTTTQYGTKAQWVYGDNRYLYFRNGKLESYQN